MEELKRLLPEIFISDLFHPGFYESKHGIVSDPEPGIVITIFFCGAFFPRQLE
jgi:hypothetical protein